MSEGTVLVSIVALAITGSGMLTGIVLALALGRRFRGAAGDGRFSCEVGERDAERRLAMPVSDARKARTPRLPFGIAAPTGAGPSPRQEPQRAASKSRSALSGSGEVEPEPSPAEV